MQIYDNYIRLYHKYSTINSHNFAAENNKYNY